MKKTIDDKVFALLYWIFGILFLLILALVLCLGEKAEYAYKARFALPNFIYLFVGIFTWLALRGLEESIIVKIHPKISSEKGIFCATIIFAGMLVYLVYNYYFITGWDAGLLVSVADGIASGNIFTLDSYESSYFSMYPNNLFLVFLFSIIMKVAGRGGILVVQCVLLAVTGYLLFKIVYQVRRSYKSAWNTWILYVMILGVCPWVSIPYSDSIGIFFPVCLMYIYLQAEYQKKVKWWFLFGMVGIVAYKIKPQLFIVVLAVCVVKGIQFLNDIISKLQIGWKRRVKGFSLTLGGMIASLLIVHVAVDSLPIAIDSKKEFGPAHFVMMGLNREMDGGFFYDDVLYTAEQTSEKRTAANLEVIQNRLEQYGVPGILEHLVKKTLNNYADGTWSWGAEGEFFLEYMENKNNTLSPFLKSLFYCSGENYQYYSGYAQTMWLLVLLGCALAFIFRKKKEPQSPLEIVMILSLVGLTIFEWIFESRARYLYCYIPLYIFLACLGLERMIRFGAEKNEFIKKIFGYNNA